MTLTQIETRPGKSAWYRSPRVIRHGVMIFFFLFLLHVAYDHQVQGGGPKGTPSIEAYCPFGGVENLYQFLTTGGYIRHIEPSAMILMGAVLLLTLLFSRGFCGWICPFGSVQEWLGLVGRKIFGKSYNPTGPWEKRLRYLKYVILGVIVVLTWRMGTLVFRPYDPFLAFFHLGNGFSEMPYAYAALGGVLLGSLKYERFFCKYACPLGAVIGVAGKLGLTKIVRSDEGCKGCNLCQKKCFAHVDFLGTNTITDAECNHCLDCVVHCPKPNVLSLKGAGWSFSHGAYAALLVAGLVTTVGLSQMWGKWRTQPVMVGYTNAAGKLDAGQIRGWMTVADISDGYRIPMPALYAGAKLPAAVDPATRLNQVAKKYKLDFEPDSMRDVVARYLGSSRTQEAPAAAERKPAGQAAVKAEGKPAEPRARAQAAAAPPQAHTGGDAEVKGFMSLSEIADKTGAPAEYILKSLQISDPVDASLPVREWMHSRGKSIQDIRDAVAEHKKGR
ncbi:MAG: 4Fe-4S binding protein [Bryobacterales bacterium]|nr:4Fe-4S binding protein [Bryobacterales bacterium]